jgi:putative SOS response-associated peptidase YedK
MCGRLRLPNDWSDIKIKLRLDDIAAPNLMPSWNIAPTQDVLVVLRDPSTGVRLSEKMRWGLIPSTAKDSKFSFTTFNARSETIDATPAFRGAWRSAQRCLVVSDGFYEWRKRKGGDKQPFAIARADSGLTVLAGLWDEWRSRDNGEIIRSCAVTTCPPNELIDPLHDRMPVILAEDDWPAWLGEASATPAELKALLRPYPSEKMKLWPVGKAVGNWRNDGPHLVEPITLDQPRFRATAAE